MLGVTSQIQQKLPSVGSIKGPKRFLSDAQYFNATTKNETLIRQLNSTNTTAKLEAMKKIIAQLSKGKDVSDMFADVVKNVVSTSLEVKKLVYLYVIHYAEEKCDEALLSIAHFQKDIEAKSQHVRALSLRVLSSIRVPLIVQIVLLAIQSRVSDPSPWVRKAAALAVPKIYRLNQEEKPQLIVIIDTLLGDHSPTVHGAAAHAFSAVCPDNFQLIHKHYRKLVKGLDQVDEWGQVVLLDMLLRYARTQFLSPFQEGYQKKTKFYGGGDDASDSDDYSEYGMDDDHRLLLSNTLPLIQSSNHAVVIAVASVYLHIAPPQEFSSKIGKALLRILRSTRERQYVALLTVHSLATQRPAAFRPYIKEFFVTPADPPFTQRMKIDTLALLADSTNVSTILREFKVYLHNAPEELLVGTVRALGRVAFFNHDVSETCLATLAELTTHPNEIVVGESVVVTRHLLQKVTTGQGKIILRLSKLLESLELPVARASIVWLLGEYLNVPQVAQASPDAFRVLVKGFAKEDITVKQQLIILGSKLVLHEYEDEKTNDRVLEVFKYLMNQVKYDESFTLRDRARIVKMIFIDESLPELRDKARRIFIVAKKEADFSDPGEDRLRFQTGSMSHVLNSAAQGYIPLSEFPTKQPDPTVRDTAFFNGDSATGSTDSGSSESESDSFYSSDESSSGSGSGSESGSESSETEEKPKPKKRSAAPPKKKPVPESSSESSEASESESESASESASESRSESSEPPKRKEAQRKAKPPAKGAKGAEQPQDLMNFMNLDFTPAATSSAPAPKTVAKASHGDPQDPLASAWGFGMSEITEKKSSSPKATSPKATSPKHSAKWFGMSAEASKAGLTAEYSFPKDAAAVYDGMTVVRVRFTNTSSEAIESISFGNEMSSEEVTVIPFKTVSDLAPSASKTSDMHVNWEAPDSDSDTGTPVDKPVRFSLCVDEAEYDSTIEQK